MSIEGRESSFRETPFDWSSYIEKGEAPNSFAIRRRKPSRHPAAVEEMLAEEERSPIIGTHIAVDPDVKEAMRRGMQRLNAAGLGILETPRGAPVGILEGARPRTYYGTKRVTAWPCERGGHPGYAVRYPDGYESWSPADTFEAAYQPTTRLDFGRAMQALKEGRRITRRGWPTAYLRIEPDKDRIGVVSGYYAPPHSARYEATNADLLAEDWCVLDDAKDDQVAL